MTKTEQKKKLFPWVFIAGLTMLIVGLLTLTLVDARAENVWGFISPILIITSLIIMGISFLLP